MSKSINTHETYALIFDLKKWVGFRVLNVYDIDSKTICIKFNSHDSTKKYLVIESGSKFYPINTFEAIKMIPSSFCSKLRKHLNNKRLELIEQINLDRVIRLEFGFTEPFNLIGEFYASGNIIFTDHNYKILTLLHPHIYKNLYPDSNCNSNNDSNNNSLKNNTSTNNCIVGNIYPFDLATNKIDLNDINVRLIFEDNLAKNDSSKSIKLKQFIVKLPLIKYSPNVLFHALTCINIDLGLKITKSTTFEDIFANIELVNKFINIINQMYNLDKIQIVKYSDHIYPYPYAYLNHKEIVVSNSTDTFGETLGKYYLSVKPIETKQYLKNINDKVKLTKQEKVIYNIQTQIDLMEQNINKIQYQIDLATDNTFQIELMFKQLYFNNLNNLDNESIKIILIIPYKKLVKFSIGEIIYELDYSTTLYNSITKFYTKIKKIKLKQSNAYELLEKQKNIKPTKLTETIIETIENISKTFEPKINWFEQFNWFITSDNLLFICGKTSDQNELIVKKYLSPSDLYIHSYAFGSGSGVLVNLLGILPKDFGSKYPSSLIEASGFLIAHTKSWDTPSPGAEKSYWVESSQVSKIPETGEYISKGSFIIRGHKNPIPTGSMEMGFGILFKYYQTNTTTITEQFEKNPTSTQSSLIEYAIPIFAPYTSLLKYKFKVKIIQGNQKVKKSIEQVITSFIKKANYVEKNAIKKISNDSIQKVLISKIRFVC
jgi:predicted ribosome quality control (RQC) complex YloA/Tae2 family protein